MDAWPVELVDYYQMVSNTMMNEYYEANMPDHCKLKQTAEGHEIKKFIKTKYVEKEWVDEDDEDPYEAYKDGRMDEDGNIKKKKKKKDKKSKKDKKEKKKRKKREV